jgi:predicted nucleic acid-binding Zn ribbon protein
MLVCPACGGRNAADRVVCAFCQHPFGQEQHRRRPGLGALLLGLLLLALLLLVVASRMPLLTGR